MSSRAILDLSKGSKGRVVQFSDNEMASKLMSMGMLIGSEVEIVRVAPFNGGFYLKVDGNGLAIRSREAATIFIDLD